MREVCLDIETTGLDPRDGHRIIEIACVELNNKIKTGKVFHTYVNPRREVPEEAFQIHGISTEFLQDKPIFDHVAHKFLEFVKDSRLVIHNAAFDLKFINYELKILGLEGFNIAEACDSLAIARSKFPGAQNSLDALCKRFGIDLSKRQKHGALTDTELLCEVYVELMGGMQSGLAFEAHPQKNKKIVNDFADTKSTSAHDKTALPKRNFPISDDDLTNHREFILKNFKSNFWGF